MDTPNTNQPPPAPPSPCGRQGSSGRGSRSSGALVPGRIPAGEADLVTTLVRAAVPGAVGEESRESRRTGKVIQGVVLKE